MSCTSKEDIEFGYSLLCLLVTNIRLLLVCEQHKYTSSVRVVKSVSLHGPWPLCTSFFAISHPCPLTTETIQRDTQIPRDPRPPARPCSPAAHSPHLDAGQPLACQFGMPRKAASVYPLARPSHARTGRFCTRSFPPPNSRPGYAGASFRPPSFRTLRSACCVAAAFKLFFVDKKSCERARVLGGGLGVSDSEDSTYDMDSHPRNSID